MRIIASDRTSTMCRQKSAFSMSSSPRTSFRSFCYSRSRRKTVTEPICPITGAPMRRDPRPMTLTYKGRSLTFDMPGWYCTASDESVHTGADMKVSDRALNRLKAAAAGLPGPEEIPRIRKRLELTQEEAGEILGGGPRAFQKYE